MKALVLEEYNRLVLKDVERPLAGAGQVVVRVRACGICGSDVHGMDGSTGRRIPPIIMGHEAAGTIEAVGEGVTGWQPGDRVTFDSTIYCGRCRSCREGRVNLCDERQVLGVSCGDYRRHGAFAEYVQVPQHILYRLPDELSFAHAAMVEAVSIGVHAVRVSQVTAADRVLVVGAGMIGLLLMQAVRAGGCASVAVSDIDEGRLKLAASLGADDCLKADSCDVAEQMRARTEGCGADVVFDAVGIQDSVHTAVAAVRKGGTVTLVGNLAPVVQVPLQVIVTREIRILGSCASAGEYPQCLEMIADGRVEVEPLLSATAPLEDGAKWFRRLYAREPGLMKVVLEP